MSQFNFIKTVAVAAPLALAISAANAERSGFTLTPMVAFQTYDVEFEDGLAGGLGLGYRFTESFGVELAGFMANVDINEVASDKARFSNNNGVQDDGSVDTWSWRFDAQYILSPGSFSPYIAASIGEIKLDSAPAGAAADNGGKFNQAGVGGGFIIPVADNLDVRFDARYLAWDMADGVNEIDDSQMSLGLAWLPFAAKEVAVVEEVVEPMDSDFDGVMDDADQCPGTEAGLVVDSVGCPMDSDADGIFDGADQCPNTPAGAVVDATGCEVVVVTDNDADGVMDDVDQCLNTPAGVAVDETGCHKMLAEQTVSMKLEVFFASGSANLTPESYAEIERLASFMSEYPTTDVVVEGHTDSQGAAAFNKKLSQQRADSVANALVNQYGVEASRVASVGYGEDYPIADNGTKAGRALNRRVVAVINETIQVEQ